MRLLAENYSNMFRVIQGNASPTCVPPTIAATCATPGARPADSKSSSRDDRVLPQRPVGLPSTRTTKMPARWHTLMMATSRRSSVSPSRFSQT
jgi:hypothetical protein